MNSAADPDDRSDAILLRSLAEGNPDAFDDLFRRHRLAVFGFIRRMVDGNSVLAEDLTQECFLRLWRNRQSLRPGAAMVRTLILTIARNLTLDFCKHRRRELQTLTEGANDAAERGHAPDETRPEKALLHQELRGEVDRAWAALPDDLRETLYLREEAGLSYEAIAEIVACPVGTVKSRVHTARRRLQDALRIYFEETESVRYVVVGEVRSGTQVRTIRRETTMPLKPTESIIPSSGYQYTIREEPQ